MDNRTSRLARASAIGLVVGALQSIPVVAATGTTWWVTNQGLDSSACGSRAKPCRSISAAIDKAVDGDVVEVGAGLYGDLNGDGAFSAPGEEHYRTDADGRSCIVCITKGIKLLSLHGADDTIIDAGNSHSVDYVVEVISSGVTLGTDGGGFTVAGGGRAGVHIGFISKGDKIIGNTAHGNVGSGFDVEVVDESFPFPFPVPISQYLFDGNTATANGSGFSVSHDETHAIPERVVFTGNVATGNTNYGFGLSGSGFQLQFIGNVANNNGTGVYIGGNNYEIRNSSIMGNRGPGILINGHNGGSGMMITGNSIIGNQGAGVYILPEAQGNTIRNNNIYGNVGVGTIAGGPAVGSTANCGIVNTGFEFTSPTPTIATNNYWGTTTGPGADPGDNAGKGCDFNQGTTVVKPFATTAYGISP
jgi:parallel beta-helix repeat protein